MREYVLNSTRHNGHAAQLLSGVLAHGVPVPDSAAEIQWRYVFLVGVGTVLAGALDYPTVITLAARLVVPLLADWCVIDVIDGQSVRRETVVHADPAKQDLAQELQRRYPPTWGTERHPLRGVEKVLRTGRPTLLSKVTTSDVPAIARDAEHLRILQELGITSGMSVPMTANGQTIGAITIVSADVRRHYTAADLALAVELARRVGVVLENARLRQELTERQRQLQELGGQLLLAQETVQRQIAYDLHDGLAQMVAGVHQRLQAFARYHQPSLPPARELLDQTVELARRTVQEVRRVINHLRPTALDAFGLGTAIRLLLEELRTEGWQVQYRENLGNDRLPPAIETALYWVTQEALSNIRKHAQTTRVAVALQRGRSAVRLEVQDWGRGFDQDEARVLGGAGERMGLVGMRDRVMLLCGCFSVESRPQQGTRIVAEIPLFASA